jgi:hypothetical protein
MKKSNAQAERHSDRAGLLRASSPLYVQNAQANLVPLRDHSAIFFYLFIDYKHKHTAVASKLHVPHLPPTPYVFNRLQAQAPRTTELTHLTRFFLFF